MPLIRLEDTGKIEWKQIGDDQTAPATGAIVVSYNRLLREYSALAGRVGPLGVEYASGQPASALQTFLGSLSLIALRFDAFTDGRGYSLARQLRETGYAGELRACGEILPDQLQFLADVGFDSFELPERFDRSVAERALKSIAMTYQRPSRARAGIWRARHEATSWPEQPHFG